MVLDALQQKAAVAIGVSGGKDSAATAFRTVEYLETLGHSGPRILIHSHLGRVEWEQSLEVCRRLADRVGLDLVIVRRERGDLLDRWHQRGTNNVERYASPSCVRLIMPWTSAGLRFCTSELKIAPICRELTRRFPGSQILSVSRHPPRGEFPPREIGSGVYPTQTRQFTTTDERLGLAPDRGLDTSRCSLLPGSKAISTARIRDMARREFRAPIASCPRNMTFQPRLDARVITLFIENSSRWRLSRPFRFVRTAGSATLPRPCLTATSAGGSNWQSSVRSNGKERRLAYLHTSCIEPDGQSICLRGVKPG